MSEGLRTDSGSPESAEPRRLVLWIFSLVVGSLLLLPYGLSPWIASEEVLRGYFFSYVELLASLLTVFAMAYASWRCRRTSGRLAAAWLTLALAFFAYSGGDFLTAVLKVELTGQALSWALNGSYLLFYPLFLIGVLGLPSAPLTRTERGRLTLDMAIVTVAAGLVIWTSLVRPLLVGSTAAKAALSLAYPVGDLALLWAVLTLVFRRKEPGTIAIYHLLAASASVLILTDLLYSYGVLTQYMEIYPWVSPGFTFSHVLAGLAAIRQTLGVRKKEPAPPVVRFSRSNLTSLYVAAACLIMAWLILIRGHLAHWSLLSVMAVPTLVILVLARQILEVRISSRLSEGLRAARDDLEIRVQERTAELAKANLDLQEEVTERNRAEETLRRRLKELTVLNAVAAIAVEAHDEETLIERATEAIKNRLFPDNCGVLLLDPQKGVLSHSPSYHARVPEGMWDGIPLGTGITGQVAASGRPMRVDDTSKAPGYIAMDPDMGSEICVPLVINDRVIGVLDAESAEKAAFTESDEQVLSTLAHQISTALGRLRAAAELAEKQERVELQLRRLGALRSIDSAINSSFDLKITLGLFLEHAADQLKVDAASVLLLSSGTQMLEYAAGTGFRTPALRHSRMPLGSFHAGRAALSRKLVHVADLEREPDGFTRSPFLLSEGFRAYFAAPLVTKGQVKGVLEVFLRRDFEPDQEWIDFLETLAGQAAIAIDNMSLFENLQRTNLDLALAYDITLEGWSRALELRDRETQGHTVRVAELTVRLAREAGIPEGEIAHVRRGALLHDIGKMGIPDAVLLKPGPLTEEEWTVMRKHPVYAFNLLSPVEFLRPALDIPYCHHERWDGKGYPRGLKGEEIPIAARVFSVIDSWDALSFERPYRSAWPPERVRTHIEAEAGKQFDPRVVRIFLDLEAEGL